MQESGEIVEPELQPASERATDADDGTGHDPESVDDVTEETGGRSDAVNQDNTGRDPETTEHIDDGGGENPEAVDEASDGTGQDLGPTGQTDDGAGEDPETTPDQRPDARDEAVDDDVERLPEFANETEADHGPPSETYDGPDDDPKATAAIGEGDGRDPEAVQDAPTETGYVHEPAAETDNGVGEDPETVDDTADGRSETSKAGEATSEDDGDVAKEPESETPAVSAQDTPVGTYPEALPETAASTDATERTTASDDMGDQSETLWRGAIDSSGYRTTDKELVFSHTDPEAYDNLQHERAPLGMSPEEYDEMRSELETALERDGLGDADVRLQGTAATLYSRNPDKEFFANEDAIRDLAADARADGDEVDPRTEEQAVQRYRDLGYGDGLRPRDKVFDQDYVATGLNKDKSDYDIQISSNTLHSGMDEYGRRISRSDHGGHWRDRDLQRRFPALRDWKRQWESKLGREVNLAGFEGPGPTGQSAFREDDWIMRRPDERSHGHKER